MKKSEIIMNIITVIFIALILGICVYITKFVIDDSNKVYVQKWTSPDTGVNYLITNNSIIEMHNPDGSISVN